MQKCFQWMQKINKNHFLCMCLIMSLKQFENLMDMEFLNKAWKIRLCHCLIAFHVQIHRLYIWNLGRISNSYNRTFSFKGLNDALGISIAGGKGSPLADIPIFIAMIQANGVAARTHKLRVSERMTDACINTSSIFLLLLLFLLPPKMFLFQLWKVLH